MTPRGGELLKTLALTAAARGADGGSGMRSSRSSTAWPNSGTGEMISIIGALNCCFCFMRLICLMFRQRKKQKFGDLQSTVEELLALR